MPTGDASGSSLPEHSAARGSHGEVYARCAQAVSAILVAALAATLTLSPIASAQDWGADDSGARNAEILRRYRGILEANPVEGRIFERVLAASGGGFERLLTDYEGLAEEHPENFAYAMIVGHLLKHAERYEGALASYERAATLDGESVLPQLGRGAALRRLERREEAAAAYELAFEQATERDDQRQILRALADLAFESHDWEAAGAYVERLVELDPDDASIRAELASLFIEHERYDDALQQYTAVLESAGRDTRQRAIAMRDIGDVMALMGRSDEAIDQYRSAMRLVDEGYWLRRELEQSIVSVYRGEGRLDELVDYYSSEWRNPSFSQLLLLADLYDEIGREDEAIDALRSAVRRDGGSIDARLALIRLLERRGEMEEVVSQYRTLMRRNSSDSTYGFRLADIYRRRGDSDEALSLLRAMNRRFNSNPDVLRQLAERFDRLGDADAALAAVERVVRIEPSDPTNYVALGEMHYMQGRRSAAERAWARILQVEGDGAVAHAMLGDVYANHGLNEEAIAHYREAVSQDDANDMYLRELADLYGSARQYPPALRHWRQLYERTDQGHLRAEARDAIIEISQELDQLESVISTAEERRRAEPEDRENGYFLAAAYSAAGRSDAAEALYRDILVNAPDDLTSLNALEKIYTRQNRFEESIAVLQRIAELNPQRARETYHRLAEISLRLYDDAQALEFARIAVDLNPDDASTHARLGDIYRQMQMLDDAVIAYRSALRLDPRAFPFYFELAEIYLALARPADADELYREVIGESRDDVQILRAGRRSMHINQAAASLPALVALVEPLAFGAQTAETHRKLLIEVFERMVSPLVFRARYGAPDDAEAAAAELAGIGRRALRPLLDGLAGDDMGVRTTALRVLSGLGDPNAALPIARMIEDEATWEREAVAAVARMGDERVIQPLIRLSSDDEAGTRRLALWALGRIGGEGLEHLASVVDSDDAGAAERAISLIGLARHGDGRALPHISAGLLSETATLQHAAIWSAGALRHEAGRSLLETLVVHGRAEQSVYAAWALGQLPSSRDSVEVLIGGTLLANGPARMAASRALLAQGHTVLVTPALRSFESAMSFYSESSGEFDTDAMLSGIFEHAGHGADGASERALSESGGELTAAIARMVTLSHESAESVLPMLAPAGRASLGGVEERVSAGTAAHIRELVVEALRRSRVHLAEMAATGEPRRVQPALDGLAAAAPLEHSELELVRGALSDADDGVRVSAVRALSGEDDAVQELVSALSDESWRVRVAACRALSTRSAHEERLAAVWRSDGSAAVRAAALMALMTASPDRAIALSHDALQQDVHERIAAVRALAQVRTDERARALLTSAMDDHDPRVRALARTSLQQ